jgi:hypothetical protein
MARSRSLHWRTWGVAALLLVAGTTVATASVEEGDVVEVEEAVLAEGPAIAHLVIRKVCLCAARGGSRREYLV